MCGTGNSRPSEFRITNGRKPLFTLRRISSQLIPKYSGTSRHGGQDGFLAAWLDDAKHYQQAIDAVEAAQLRAERRQDGQPGLTRRSFARCQIKIGAHPT